MRSNKVRDTWMNHDIFSRETDSAAIEIESHSWLMRSNVSQMRLNQSRMGWNEMCDTPMGDDVISHRGAALAQYTCTHTHVHTHMYTHTCTHTHVHTHMYTHYFTSKEQSVHTYTYFEKTKLATCKTNLQNRLAKQTCKTNLQLAARTTLHHRCSSVSLYRHACT